MKTLNFSFLMGLVLTALATATPRSANAWGIIGHKSSAIIAWNKLSPAARDMVKNIMLDGTPGQASVTNLFVNGSTWADEVRVLGGLFHTGDYHYETVPDDNGKDLLTQKNREPGVVEAILRAQEVLLSEKSDQKQKLYALKFMIHLIGDVHQPLHVGRKNDEGGNKIEIKFFTRTMSLHQVWDMGIIEKKYGPIFKKNPSTDPAAIYSKALASGNLPQIRINPEASVGDWYRESRELMNQAYDLSYKNSQDAYLAKHNVSVGTRIYLAGERIAIILNRIAEERKISRPDLNLIQTIQSLFGQLDTVVFLGGKGSKGKR